ncbi:MAG: thiamine phosphate synthase [Mariprofundaceae bacterium]
MKNITGIYGILPADLEMADMLARAESALRGGVHTLQLRDKEQGYKQALKRARALRKLTITYQAMLIINDSVQLAQDANADGVHLGRNDAPNLMQLRSDAGESLIIGISCKDDATFARHALESGADYLSFGSVFPTASKDNAAPIGLERLRKARQLFPEANIVAIGGITEESLPAVRAAGVDATAMIHALFAEDNIEARAAALVAAWEQK